VELAGVLDGDEVDAMREAVDERRVRCGADLESGASETRGS
jgi:hypothetical protein